MKNDVQNLTARKGCLLHWEITNKCNLACKFCYRGKDIPPYDLPLGDCIKILESFREFLRKNNFTGSIIFSGGDPLLRDDFMDILKIASEYKNLGIINRISVSGNPDRINADIGQRLKSAGVYVYQFSLDGLETTHNWFRKNGSFRQTLAAIKCLKQAGLRTAVKFTLSRINSSELIEAIKSSLEAGVSAFSFTQLVAVGAGKNLEKEVVTPAEFRNILVEVLGFLESLPPQQAHIRTAIVSNEPLYGRLFYESGRWDEYMQKYLNLPQNLTACGKGLVFSVLPDGEVRMRRFIPVKVGRFPQESFEHIYKTSDFLRSLEDETYYRKKAGFAKCRACPMLNHCGYMVADAYYATGDAAAPNPKCWVEPR